MLLIAIFLILNTSIVLLLNLVNKKEEYLVNYNKSFLLEAKNKNEIKQEEVDLLEKEINEIKNVENRISEIREVYFSNALLYEKKVLEGKGTKKIIYLTIDDGPLKYTESFLKTLDKYDVLATFFVVGYTSQSYGSVYKKIVDGGHTIGNHTYSHKIKNGIYRSEDSFIKDILKQEELIYEKTGVKTNILRFPGGVNTAGKTLANKILLKMRELNYGYSNWDAAAGDANGVYVSKEQIYKNIIEKVGNKNIAVILMHDFNKNSLDSLPSVINTLKNKGYIFLPLFYESSKIVK